MISLDIKYMLPNNYVIYWSSQKPLCVQIGICVCCRQHCIAIVDLNSPRDVVRRIARQSRYAISCIEWNPHASHADYFLTAVRAPSVITSCFPHSPECVSLQALLHPMCTIHVIHTEWCWFWSLILLTDYFLLLAFVWPTTFSSYYSRLDWVMHRSSKEEPLSIIGKRFFPCCYLTNSVKSKH